MASTRWVSIAAFVVISCGLAKSPGSVAVSVEWEGGKPDGVWWIWATVQQEEDGKTTRLVSPEPRAFCKDPAGEISKETAGADACAPSVDIPLEGVPNGEGRVLVIEVRDGESVRNPVRYYGKSVPFVLKPGETNDEVTVWLRLTEMDGDIALVFGPERQPSNGVIARSDLSQASVVVTTSSPEATAVVLANNATFVKSEQVALDGGDTKGCPEPLADGTRCVVRPKDLVPDTDAENGLYSVYVAFVDEYENRSKVLSASVQVDEAAPQVLSAALSKTLAKPGDAVVLAVTLDEALDESGAPPTLSSTAGDGVDLEGPKQVPGTNTYQWTVTLGAVADGERHRFGVTGLRDPFGNEVDEPMLYADPERTLPLEVTVDALPPALRDAAVLLENEGGLVGDDGLYFGLPEGADERSGELSFAFVIEERNPSDVPPVVRLAGVALETATVERATERDGEALRGYRYRYEVRQEDWVGFEGDIDVEVAVEDAAGNPAVLPLATSPAMLRFDFVRPRVEDEPRDCALYPEVAGVGDALTYQVSATEPLAAAPEVEPDLASLGLAGAGVTPSAGNRTWTWRWVQPENEVDWVAPGDVRVKARLVDLAGNASESFVCERSAVVDGVAPRLQAISLAASPDVDDDGTVVVGPRTVALTAHVEIVESREMQASTVAVVVASPGAGVPFQTTGFVEKAGEPRTWVWDGAMDRAVLDTVRVDGHWPIRVEIADDVGNPVTTEVLDPVVVRFDYTAPGATCVLNRSLARPGDHLQVTVTPTESVLEDDVAVTTLATGFALAPTDDSSVLAYSAIGVADQDWTYEVRLTDRVGNGTDEPVCAGGGSIDGVAPTLVEGTGTTPSPTVYGIEDPGQPQKNRLSFAFALREAHPPVLPGSGGCSVEANCPRVAVAGRTTGTLTRRPDLDVATDGTWGFEYEAELLAANYGAIEQDATISIAWQDAAGNEHPIDLDEKVRLDFVRPQAQCGLFPPPGPEPYRIGQEVLLQVSPIEALDASAEPQVEENFEPASPSTARSPYFVPTDNPLQYVANVVEGDGEREFTLRVNLTDAAGNETPEGSTACVEGDIAGAMDGERPSVSGLRVFPADSGIQDGQARPLRLGRTVRATFVTSGDSERLPEVRIGGGDMSAVSAPTGSGIESEWTFERVLNGTEGEGAQSVTVTVEDSAGNTTRIATLEGVPELDFTNPTAECVANLAEAKVGDTLRVYATFSEPIDETSLILSSGLSLERSDTMSQPNDDRPRFVFEATVEKGQYDGPWSFELSATDKAGNPGSGGVLCRGGGEIDSRPIVVTPAGVTARYWDPDVRREWIETGLFAKAGSIVTVEFLLDDAPVEGTLAVKIGGADVHEITADGLKYRCTYEVTSDDIAGPESVTVDVTDSAGNRTIMSLATLVKDFAPPALAGVPYFERDDLYARARMGPNELYAKAGTMVTVSFGLDEPTSLVPIVRAAGEDTAASEWNAGDSYVIGELADRGVEGETIVSGIVVDRAGNRAELALGSIHYDYEPPEGLAGEKQPYVELFRAPWGAEDCQYEPAFEIRVCSPPGDNGTSWPWCPSAAIDIFERDSLLTVYSSEYINYNNICSNIVITKYIRDSNGIINAINLGGDHLAACIAETDRAGNESTIRFIGNNEYVSVPHNGQSDSAYALNNLYQYIYHDEYTNLRFNDLAYESLRFRDGVTVEAVAEGKWTNLVSSNVAEFIDIGKMAYDASRGSMMLIGGKECRYDTSLYCDTDRHVYRYIYNHWHTSGYDMLYTTYNANLIYSRDIDAMVFINGANDIWEYVSNYDYWLRRQSLGVIPGSLGVNVYDSKRNVLVNYDLNGAWALNVGTYEWSWIGGDAFPEGKVSAKAIYDVNRDVVILVGGEATDAWGEPSVVWEWDPSEKTWTEFIPGGIGPGAVWDFETAYDLSRGIVYLFGGFTDGAGMSSTLWAYDGGKGKWDKASEFGQGIVPSGRFGHSMAYDVHRDRLVVVGGIIDREGVIDDWWEWRPDTGGWSCRDKYDCYDNTILGGNYNTAIYYDSMSGSVEMLSGVCGGIGQCKETSMSLGIYKYIDGLGVWHKIMPATLVNPAWRSGFSASFDSARRKLIMFGGEQRSDTWEWDVASQVWAEANPASSPPVLQSHAMAYDEGSGLTVLFGGLEGDSASGVVSERTFEWSPIEGNWFERFRGENEWPPRRTKAAMMYHPRLERVAMLGGNGLLDDPPIPDGETWIWGREQVGWWRAPFLQPEPLDVDNVALVWDDERSKLVLFDVNRVLEWNEGNGAWSERTPDVGPAPSEAYSGTTAAYDDLSSRSIVRHWLPSTQSTLVGEAQGGDETWAWNLSDSRPAILWRPSISSAGLNRGSQFTELSISSSASGSSHSAGGTGVPVTGAEMRVWDCIRGSWRTVDSAGEPFPDFSLLEWKTTDVDEIRSLLLGLDLAVNVAVTTREATGSGQDPAKVYVDDIELRLRYKQP